MERVGLPVQEQSVGCSKVDGQRGVELELCQDGEVVGGDVGVGAAVDVVLVQPVGVDGPQHTRHLHVQLREEHIVDHALEVVSGTGEGGVIV